MKRIFFLVLVLCMSMITYADTFNNLWKEVETAQKKDLPRQQLSILDKIIKKADKEKEYGHLLKAELRTAQVAYSISPDSLPDIVNKLTEKAEKVQKKNQVLGLVYKFIIGRIYQCNAPNAKRYRWSQDDVSILGDSALSIGNRMVDEALSRPDLLGSCKTKGYVPFVEEGVDSRIYDNDLLSVMCYEVKRFDILRDYYEGKNRSAAMMATLEMIKQRNDNYAVDDISKSTYLKSLDSLISKYGTLTECGEVAIEKLRYMEKCNVPAKEVYDYAQYSIMKWGNWKRADKFRNIITRITLPSFDSKLSTYIALPQQTSTLWMNKVRNVNTVTMDIYPVDITGDHEYGYDLRYNDYNVLRRKKSDKSVVSISRTFDNKAPYTQSSDSIEIPALPLGVYIVEVECDNEKVEPHRFLYHVSDMYVISQKLSDNKTKFIAVSATTGQPVPEASLKIYPLNRNKKAEILKFDANGELIYNQGKNNIYNRIYVSKDNDVYRPARSLRASFSDYDNPHNIENIEIFTDRSIYRPGQTVYAAALAYKEKMHQDAEVISGKTLDFELYDANGRVVESKSATTDQFGKAAVDFILPKQGLTGSFSISCKQNGSCHFMVEEYKRPTFDVTFQDNDTNYKNGDTITVQGVAKTYSGMPVQNGKVVYTVTRNSRFWWYHNNDDEAILCQEETTTDNDGVFKVKMPMLLPDNISKGKANRWRSFYNIVADVTVTDISGESHEATLSLPIGTRKTVMYCDLPEKIVKDSLKNICFHLKNMSGTDVKEDITYSFDNSKTYHTTSNTINDISRIARNLGYGRHTLTAICKDDTLQQDFVIFSPKEEIPAVETEDWAYQSSEVFPDKGKVYIQVGTSEKNTCVYYTILTKNKVLEEGRINTDGKLICKELTYKEEYGEGILLTFAWVKNGKLFTHEMQIAKPLPDKTLTATWKTFRNKLVPGDKEEWTLNIMTAEGKKINASVMAVLFDKSLQQVYNHSWNINLNLYRHIPSTSWNGWKSMPLSQSSTLKKKMLNYPDLKYSQFVNIDAFRYNTYSHRVLGVDRIKLTRSTAAPMSMSAANAKVTVEADMETADAAPLETTMMRKASGGNNVEETTNNSSLRSDFSETAFFYPQLVTDKEGNVNIRFTLPQSVTTWQFMALANDKEMRHTVFMDEAVAQKTVMVQPNMPRFLRHNDNAQIVSALYNNSANAITGTSTIEILDANTESVVLTDQQSFALNANESKDIAFKINTENLQPSTLYVCRITAQGNGYSDGEQHYLFIMPDKQTVTVTRPFTQLEKGKKTISIDSMIPSTAIGQKTLTVEYTNNPMWLAVQALPSLGTGNEKNAISLVTSYYANKIGKFIMHSNPRIQDIVKKWEKDDKALSSPLEENEELKDILLDETPWVMDATNETSQKQRLGNFFNENQIENRLETTLQYLENLQNGDGSWSWWPSMPGSEYITTTVVKTLVRLNALTGENTDYKDMLDRGFKYLDKEVVIDVERMKEMERKGRLKINGISNTHLNYLYSLAMYNREVSGKTKEAKDYLLGKLQKMTTVQNLHDKALTSVILAKNKFTTKAKEYIQSLEEYTVYKEEMGRYYDTKKATYSWCDYRIPTQVSALEAIQIVCPEKKQTISEMRRWLLQEKRTQGWTTPINAVNAIYALINDNTETLNKKEMSKLYIDDRKLDTSSQTAGLGYIKNTTSADNIHKFTAEKSSDGISWGVLYVQFEQKTTDVENSQSGISVERRIICTNNNMKVGDKVKVQITIVADRDYDFVTIQDRRAACMQPIQQISGYRNGYYMSTKDNSTNYYYNTLSKGTHRIETEYFIDRQGEYNTGTCEVQCTYSPGYKATDKAIKLIIK